MSDESIFKPIVDLVKEARKWVVDTGTVYKSGLTIEDVTKEYGAPTRVLNIQRGYHLKRDLMQPFVGFYHLFKTALHILYLLYLRIKFILMLLLTLVRPKTYWDSLKEVFHKLGEILFETIGLLVRGVAQILMFPLTYLVRIPLRAFLTWQNEGHLPKIEDSVKVKKSLDVLRGHAPVEQKHDHYVILYRKLRSGLQKGVSTSVSEEAFMNESKAADDFLMFYEHTRSKIEEIKKKQEDKALTPREAATYIRTKTLELEKGSNLRIRAMLRLFDKPALQEQPPTLSVLPRAIRH